MGHSTISMTMRYAHLSPAHLRAAVNMAPLGDLVSNLPTETVTTRQPTSENRTEERPEDIEELAEIVEAPSGIEPLHRSFADCCVVSPVVNWSTHRTSLLTQPLEFAP
jgi:hypothetical protein